MFLTLQPIEKQDSGDQPAGDLSTNHIVSYITAYREAGFLSSLSGDQPAGDLSANHIVSYITAYREAGFLASLAGDQPAGDLIFDKVHYNNGSFYNKQSGVYTVPFDGYYLITEQVLNVTKFFIKMFFHRRRRDP